MRWEKITVVGVGLLGGSLGLASQRRGLAARIEGYVRRKESVDECRKFGVVDAATTDLSAAVAGADLVILCTPLAQMRELTERMLPALKKGVIITDVGSVKGGVVAELEPLLARVGGFFVGSHPMAGGEKMGVGASRADLFEGTVCLVTPTPKTDAAALKSIGEFWRSLGAKVLELAPQLHDELVSRASHLPHVVAAQLAAYILDPVHPPGQAAICANGFRDTTRIASGSPEMWRDIAVANRENLGRVLDVFIEDLKGFRAKLAKGDAAAIQEFFEQARQRRERWVGGVNSPE